MTKIFKNPYFLTGLVLKLLCIPLFDSPYINNLFIPFIDKSIENLGANPWLLLPAHYFPYGTVLFVILFIPKYIAYLMFGASTLGGGLLSLILFKGILLTFDLLLFRTLTRIAPDRISGLIWFFWLNPILFYISYVHAQLDVIVTFFCIYSIYSLYKNKIIKSALLFTAALLCKFHVIFIVPFLLVFMWNRMFFRQAVQNIAMWLGITLVLSAVGFLPLYFARTFLYASTSSPEALRIFAANLNFGENVVLYLGMVFLLITLGRLCVSTRITERGLIFGCGILFGGLLLVTNPMPGWYFWFIPFVSLFYSLYFNMPKSLYWALCFFYILHFIVIDKLADLPTLINGFGFTLLQTSLAGLLISMWRLSITREAPASRRARPVLVGLAGDSGAGKNSLSAVLSDLFNTRKALVLEGDNYHKWERGNQNWRDFTHLNPRANDLVKMVSHMVQLGEGTGISHPHYDHATGEFTSPIETQPQPVIIVQGLHTLYLRGMRDYLDLKIFLAPHELVRLNWKINRDVNERGYTLQKVLDSFAARQADSVAYIDPQKQFADWIIEYFPRNEITRDEVISGKSIELAVRHYVWNDAVIIDSIEVLANVLKCEMRFEIIPNEISRIAISIYGNPNAQEIEHAANLCFTNIRQITRGRTPPVWLSGYDGINQLMALALMQQRLCVKKDEAVY